jgi:hypothetical protein
MTAKRLLLSAETMARIALAAVRGEMMMAEVDAKYQEHPVQISNWKKHLLEGAICRTTDPRGYSEAGSAAAVCGGTLTRPSVLQDLPFKHGLNCSWHSPISEAGWPRRRSRDDERRGIITGS